VITEKYREISNNTYGHIQEENKAQQRINDQKEEIYHPNEL